MRTPCSVLTILFVAWTASGQTVEANAPRRTISVTGSFTTKAEPDVVVWSLTTTDESKDLNEAVGNSNGKLKTILALAKDVGVDEKDIQTGQLNVQRRYDQTVLKGREFKGFAVYRNVTIKQRDLSRFDEYVGRLFTGVEVESSYGFQSSRIEDLRWEARLKALEMAKKKAQAMAETLGAKLGKVMTIQEGPEAFEPWRSVYPVSPASNASQIVAWGGAGAPEGAFAPGPNTLAPGLLDIRMSVNVTFELE
jgi:hypothetical protein